MLAVKNFADTGSRAAPASTPNPTYWPYGTISPNQSCVGVQSPLYIGGGAPLVQAKAMVYWLSGDATYAADARTHILSLIDTSDYGEGVYSGNDQCILNLSREFPPFIIAADLLEGYSGWTATDKQAFQQWLATVVYKKVDYANDAQAHNWGAAGSSASAMIADYLTGSGILMVDRDGATITSHVLRNRRSLVLDRWRQQLRCSVSLTDAIIRSSSSVFVLFLSTATVQESVLFDF